MIFEEERCNFLNGLITCLNLNVDTNECATGDHNCHVNAKCINEPGTFSCVCEDGYTGNGFFCTGNIISHNNILGSLPSNVIFGYLIISLMIFLFVQLFTL